MHPADVKSFPPILRRLRMRIALVCPTYIPGRSYQENLWAEQLARQGHSVRVFLPADSGNPHAKVERVERSVDSYERQYASTRRLPRSTFWSGSVHKLVRDFRPELIVIFGDKTFSGRVVKEPALRDVPAISTYSENASMHEFNWRKKGISFKQRLWAIGFVVLRALPIRAVCRRSDVIVNNTPQARDILLRLFSESERPAIERKMVEMPLGFSPEHFGFDPALRHRVRTQLGVKDDEVLVCASSAFTTIKAPFIAMIVSALRSTMQDDAKIKAVIVGFSDKPEYAGVSKQIGEHIEGGPCADRFIKAPFADRERLNEMFNASDIAAFGRASISCQEALGTGLVTCFVDNGSLNHLVTAPEQGLFFRQEDEADLAAKLAGCAAIVKRHGDSGHEAFRRGLARAAAWLGYDRIVASILERVKQSRADKAPTP